MPSPLLSDDTGDMSQVQPIELAARLAARLCHDFISPVSAIVSGLDLIEDPEQQDMREEAMALIAASARKLAAHLSFARIAFGGSSASESFDVRELEKLSRDLFEHVRAELEWNVEMAALEKPAARAMLNLAQLGASALPVGGLARLTAAQGIGGTVILTLLAEGARARLRPEAADGLEGRPFGEGLAGHWVQAYFLRSVIDQAGGTLEHSAEEGVIRIKVALPG
jgi:histidine phosphotransferase ChpT